MNKTDRESCINTIKSLRRLALNINGCIDVVDDQNCDKMIEILESEPHWIPYTGECDLMDNEEVLVFQKDGTINGQIRHAMFCDFNGKKKFVTWEEGITIYNVLAYMPLPEPYKGVTE